MSRYDSSTLASWATKLWRARQYVRMACNRAGPMLGANHLLGAPGIGFRDAPHRESLDTAGLGPEAHSKPKPPNPRSAARGAQRPSRSTPSYGITRLRSQVIRPVI